MDFHRGWFVQIVCFNGRDEPSNDYYNLFDRILCGTEYSGHGTADFSE
jgi:hypothetical protein